MLFLTNMAVIMMIIFCTSLATGDTSAILFSAMSLMIPGAKFLITVASTLTTAFLTTSVLVDTFAEGPFADA